MCDQDDVTQHTPAAKGYPNALIYFHLQEKHFSHFLNTKIIRGIMVAEKSVVKTGSLQFNLVNILLRLFLMTYFVDAILTSYFITMPSKTSLAY